MQLQCEDTLQYVTIHDSYMAMDQYLLIAFLGG